MSEDAIRVFVSYSWDSEEHKDKVYHLAQALRDDGIDCIIDQFVQSLDNWDRWMLDQIDESAFVLIICTERYYQRYRGKEEVNKGLGVTWESTLIMGRIYNAQGRNTKFYPIFFDTPNRDIIPDGIRTTFYDLSGHDLLSLDNDKNRLIEDRGYKELYRLLTKQPAAIPRKLGSLIKLETVDREIEQQTKRERPQREQRLREVEQRQGSLTRRQVLQWAIPAGVGVVGVSVASQLFTIDYSKLEGFLKAGQYKEADRETTNLMLKVGNREKEGFLDDTSLQNFPCEVLSKIDRLWVDSSGGKFGFSVQKKIYAENCSGKPDGQYDEKAWQCFGDQVGWRVKGQWISYEDVTFNTQAFQGHLPWSYGWVGGVRLGGVFWGVPSLAQRIVKCSTARS